LQFASLAQLSSIHVLKSRKMLIISIKWDWCMKIYDYAGKKNISGERIREARTRLHLTQTNLAVQLKLVGVDVERDSISRIEIGTRFVTDYEIRELSKILKVTPTWLLGME
jgi:DNA-binding XRE family transcriptional regulator